MTTTIETPADPAALTDLDERIAIEHAAEFPTILHAMCDGHAADAAEYLAAGDPEAAALSARLSARYARALDILALGPALGPAVPR